MATKILKFGAEWCSPCSAQDDILESVDTVPVEHIDVDESGERATEYNIRSVPTLVILNDGEEIERFIGVTQLEQIESAIES